MTLREQARDGDVTALSHRLRARRFQAFEVACAELDRPLRILDVGGTVEFWEHRAWHDRPGVEITTVNLTAGEQRHDNIRPMVGDATALPFGDAEFDITFSNSVIEHLFTWEAQERMAAEARRVAARYWIQTPNYWFPMEPHFLTPGWQWMPAELRIRILQRHTVGQMGRCPDRAEAQERVLEVALLSRRRLRRLFPEATLVPERFAGLVKSWTAVGGW